VKLVLTFQLSDLSLQDFNGLFEGANCDAQVTDNSLDNLESLNALARRARDLKDSLVMRNMDISGFGSGHDVSSQSSDAPTSVGPIVAEPTDGVGVRGVGSVSSASPAPSFDSEIERIVYQQSVRCRWRFSDPDYFVNTADVIARAVIDFQKREATK